MEVDEKASEQPCQVEAARNLPSEGYRYMYDRVEDKVRLLAFAG